VGTIQRSRPVESVPAARTHCPFLRELLNFGFVGFVGTMITIGGANLMRHLHAGGPLTSVVVPTMVSTLVSYLANRYWTFPHRDSTGSGREVALYFGLNGIGNALQVACTGFTYYTLGLHGGVAYNAALLTGLVLAAAFRYWSYRKWVFTGCPGRMRRRGRAAQQAEINRMRDLLAD
jgi:putative flippase GtrA